MIDETSSNVENQGYPRKFLSQHQNIGKHYVKGFTHDPKMQYNFNVVYLLTIQFY